MGPAQGVLVECEDAFAASAGLFAAACAELAAPQAAVMTHAQLENLLGARMREVTRQLFQDHLTLRARDEARTERGRGRRRCRALEDRAGPAPVAGHGVRQGHRGSDRLSRHWCGGPAPHRCGAEPAGRNALSRAGQARRDRVRPRQLRRRLRADQRPHRLRHRAPAGPGTRCQRRGGHRRVLRRPGAGSLHRHHTADLVGRRQGRGDKARSPA